MFITLFILTAFSGTGSDSRMRSCTGRDTQHLHMLIDVLENANYFISEIKAFGEPLREGQEQYIPSSQRTLTVAAALIDARPANDVFHTSHHYLEITLCNKETESQVWIAEFGSYGLSLVDKKMIKQREEIKHIYTVNFETKVDARLLFEVLRAYMDKDYSVIHSNCQHFVETVFFKLCGRPLEDPITLFEPCGEEVYQLQLGEHGQSLCQAYQEMFPLSALKAAQEMLETAKVAQETAKAAQEMLETTTGCAQNVKEPTMGFT